MIGSRFDCGGVCSLAWAAENERCEAEFVGGSQRERHRILGWPVLSVAEGTTGVEQHDLLTRRKLQSLPQSVGRRFIGWRCREFELFIVSGEAERFFDQVQVVIHGGNWL